jgi:NDP-sugar pyrophosphorylase family protein
VEYSIVMDNVLIKGIRRLEESIIGSNAKLIKEAEVDGIRLQVGDYSEIIL